MQAQIHEGMPSIGLTSSQREMVDHPVPYDQDRMFDALENPAIKDVRVFRQARKKKNKTSKASRRKNR